MIANFHWTLKILPRNERGKTVLLPRKSKLISDILTRPRKSKKDYKQEKYGVKRKERKNTKESAADMSGFKKVVRRDFVLRFAVQWCKDW